jgi:hypothetical protein
VKESLIDTCDWIQGSVNLKIKLCTSFLCKDNGVCITASV